MAVKRNIAVWEFDSGTERDNTGSTKGLIAGDLCYVRNDAVYLATSVGAGSSTWTGVGVLTPAVLDFKGSVRCRTTANVDLAGGGLADGTTHDGVTVAEGERVLVMAQTATEENGIYDVPASGAASRSGDADDDTKVTTGLFAHVSEGTSYADTWWFLSTNDPITLDTTGLTFENFSATLDHGGLVGLGDDDHTQYLLVSGSRAMSGDLDMGNNAVQNSGGVEFVHLAANPGGTAADTLYQDDGTNYEDGTLVWGNKLVVTGEVSVGDPGSEQGAVQVSGATFDGILKVSDFGGTRDALGVFHRHSSTEGANLLLTRSKSDTSSHGNVASGDTLATVYGAGWHTDSYYLAAAIDFEVDGTPGVGDMPGRIVFRVTPDGGAVPVERMRIDSAGSVLIAGASTGDAASYADDFVIGSGSGAVGMTFFTGPADSASLVWADNIGSAAGRLLYQHGGINDYFQFYTASGARFQMRSDELRPLGTQTLGSSGNPWGTAYLGASGGGSAHEVLGGSMSFADVTTDATNKAFAWTARPYTNSDGNWRALSAFSTVSANTLAIGGTTSIDGATAIQFWTSTAVNTAGTLRGSINSVGAWNVGASGVAANHSVLGFATTFADVTTDLTDKTYYWSARAHTNSDGNWTFMSTRGQVAANTLYLGGAGGEGATQVVFYTSPAVNTAGTLRGSINSSGAWTIGTDGGGGVHSLNGNSITFRDNTTDLTNKTFWFQANPYTNADGQWRWARVLATSADNRLDIGGDGSSDGATVVNFYTATALNTSGTLAGSIDSTQRWNIGTSGSGSIHQIFGTAIRFGTESTDATNKSFVWVARPYTNADGDWRVVEYSATSGGNTVRFGGNGAQDSATALEFYTATALNTSGTLRGSIDNAGDLNWVGNIHVAGATSGDGVSGANDLVIGAGTSGHGLAIYSGATQTGSMLFTDDTVNGSGFTYDHNAGIMRIQIEGTNEIRIDNTSMDPNTDGGMGLGGAANAWTHLSLAERADHVETPTATTGEIWARNDAPNTLMYTDDTGVDHPLSRMDPVWLTPRNGMIPVANGTTLQTGSAGIGGTVEYLEYDPDSDERTDWNFRLPESYTGGDLTFTIYYAGSTAFGAADDVRWDMSIGRMIAGENLASVSLDTKNSNTDVPGVTAADTLILFPVTIPQADLDGAVAGDVIHFRLTRDANHATDDSYTGFAKVIGVLVEDG